MAKKPGPVLIELDEAPEVGPAETPPVVETAVHDPAMLRAARLAARPPSRLARWFWALLASLLGLVVSVAAWDFGAGLLQRSPVLGGLATGLAALFGLVLLLIGLREWAAFARLRRIDVVHRAAEAALAAGDLGAAREVGARLMRLYADRDELDWGRQRLQERQADVFDADGYLALAEAELLAPLDAAAQAEVEAAARQVATVTAVVPLALADVAVALTANMRMIRRVAEVYGGRSGTLGSWRLTRSVLTHLVATGAVAVGDDLIGSVAGGGVLSKISRRFGEGVVNGALTARVGVAAMEVCRPLPFHATARPSVTGLVRRALAGLFGGAKG
ncbi:MAG: TIGR01620 family protein [Rhodobacteraceae bacterium]|nr:TIGR01620 family protein [Paracoccaceae bacterium]